MHGHSICGCRSGSATSSQCHANNCDNGCVHWGWVTVIIINTSRDTREGRQTIVCLAHCAVHGERMILDWRVWWVCIAAVVICAEVILSSSIAVIIQLSAHIILDDRT